MTQDEIIRMAREAGIGIWYDTARSLEGTIENLERFAALVAAHEREKQAEQEPIENNDWKKASYIRETLNAEQAEQEPVAWGLFLDDKLHSLSKTQPSLEGYHETWSCKPLYAAPVSIEAAVLAEREACAKVCEGFGEWRDTSGVDCAAAIRARGEK